MSTMFGFCCLHAPIYNLLQVTYTCIHDMAQDTLSRKDQGEGIMHFCTVLIGPSPSCDRSKYKDARVFVVHVFGTCTCVCVVHVCVRVRVHVYVCT